MQPRITAVMELLVQHPFAGHATERPGVRRAITSPYPYAVTYSVGDAEIVILGLRHLARRPV